MELKGSLQHSQQPVTCPYPEPDRASLCPPFYFSKIHFNIIVPFMPGSSKYISFPQVFPLKPCMYLLLLGVPLQDLSGTDAYCRQGAAEMSIQSGFITVFAAVHQHLISPMV